jgi:hypothetical protein
MLTRRQEPGATLTHHEVDFLLGVSRSSEDVARLRAAGIDYHKFYQFQADAMPVAQFRALWARHGAYLRAEATRRGISAPDPSEYGPVDRTGRAYWIWRHEQRRSEGR